MTQFRSERQDAPRIRLARVERGQDAKRIQKVREQLAIGRRQRQRPPKPPQCRAHVVPGAVG